MLRIIDRYLLRELAFGFFASAAVLLVVTLGGTVTDVLTKVARGKLPPNLVFEILGLRTLDALTVLVPLAVFIGVLLAYGRLWRDNEMAVLQGAGQPVTGLLRPLAWLALPTVAVVGLISFWLAPAAIRLSHSLVQEANRSLVVAGLEAGRFVQLPGRGGVIYVGGMSDAGTRFERMFVQTERTDGEDTRIDVITAERGELGHESDGVGRYLALRDGFRVEGRIGHDDFRLLRFKGNDIALADSDDDATPDSLKRAAPLPELLTSSEPLQQAELHWRLAAPLSVVILALLAVPLARTRPREARYASLLVALLGYLVYLGWLGLARSFIEQGKVPPALGLWWVHLPAAAVALWLLRRSDRLKRPAPAPLRQKKVRA
ncbi:LPS export ABC transporter permease LptF [Tahibacter harae]|uniref:Lipopolysaccharide export system permease protein LptF n=1 Tax=Tahibacter harae TaxID=2963937 RepID=A0ABT1QQU3_9GAMM|nr:LPS export ABC transporter permease LptF [Tahibacter harae]MCQ4164673.1 LPS export ABC transporter permease LptF [Tahibacter harae]